MKVIITGGTGLIGSALARDLAKNAHEVIILTRDPSQKRDTLPATARLVRWDGETGEGWSQEAEGADAIVNLAGENLGPQAGLWTTERKRRILQSRTRATAAVVDAIRRTEQRPQMLLQGSAVGYYGTHADELISEKAPAGSDFLAEVVKAWEGASEPVEALGVRRVLARTGIVLSRKGSTLDLLSLPFKLFVGGKVGSGNQFMPWIHIEDQVAAMCFLIGNAAASGPYNLAAPNPVRNKEMGETIARVLGRPSLMPTPAFMLKLLLGELSTIVLDGQRAIPTRLHEEGYEFQFPNLEGALRDLLKG